MRHFIVFLLFTTVFFGQGCADSIVSPQIAVPFEPITEEVIDYNQGFGVLPGTLWATSTSQGTVRIDADLPTLLPNVTVIRLSSSGLDQNKFQNLTYALGMPVGLMGENPRNLAYGFTWTNDEGIVLSYDSKLHRVTFADSRETPSTQLVSSWPEEILLIRAVKSFLDERGVDEFTYRNISIQHDWLTWAERVQNGQTCVTNEVKNKLNEIDSATKLLSMYPPAEQSGDCLTAVYPSRILMTFERVIDERNIIGKNGTPELGGMMVINAETLEIEYGWYTFGEEAQRSEYPAISRALMEQRMFDGGLGGVKVGAVRVEEAYFAYIRLPNPDPYDEQYLVPAVVGKGTHELDDGSTEPYHIVVPLIQE